jgi:hypothetical protein
VREIKKPAASGPLSSPPGATAGQNSPRRGTDPCCVERMTPCDRGRVQRVNGKER